MPNPTRDIDIEELFVPVSVRAYSSLADPDHISGLRDDELSVTHRMVASRKAEFATARACARAALADFGVDAAIPKREDGSPAWPDGSAGSISHTRGFCLAVGSRGDHLLGIDVEEVARMSTTIERRILVQEEQDTLAGLAPDERQQRVATIFAAKEAFYKAHFAFDARYLGFDVIAVDMDNDQLTFSPGSGVVRPSVVERVVGRVRVSQGRVIVGVSIDPLGLAPALPSQG